VRDESREKYRRITADFVTQGAQAIIPCCTGISLLVDQRDAAVPPIDTTYLHKRGAAEWAPGAALKRPVCTAPYAAANCATYSALK